ncbi:acyl-CoA dehydrogenase family protein [Salicibibacter cibi]|uniref:Acyl-CoA dehydrogenase family protein n=2 Tax=Salicibibacter cibi TaxID=2743001 RepID=A0A7T6Z9X6_9BACI|nr:acyl-CoA dehydrogenase family protein [Salicibibacter cibi]QQK79091.1 acyl-CoA dehydrogenase family protein [Salicibibacter cibi]
MSTRLSGTPWWEDLLDYPDIFTPEDLTEDEVMIAKTTEKFVEQQILPNVESLELHDYQKEQETFAAAGELGLLAIEIPEAYGGLELGKHVAGLVAENIGNGGGSFSVSYNIHAGVGTSPYVNYGNEEQKKKYLSQLGSGAWVGAYALTEPSAGSDALKGKTKAVWNKEKNAWVLTGEKQWITNAKLAQVYVVFANTDAGMTAFIVEREMDGLSVGPEEKKMGINGTSTATLILDEVAVPQENMLGEVGKGHKIAMNTLNLARLKLSFANLGTAKRALELSVKYGKERKQFQQLLVDFPMIKEKIATMNTAIFGVESLVYQTAARIDDALEKSSEQDAQAVVGQFIAECAAGKIQGSEVLAAVADEAVQIHGGYGFMQEYEVERIYRDARISRIFEGTNEINRLAVAKDLFSRFRDQPVEKQIETDRNAIFILEAERHFTDLLKTGVAKNQEFSRLVADIYKEISVMRAAYLRTEKAGSGATLKQLMTDVICEEGYEKVERDLIRLWSAVDEGAKGQEMIGSIRARAHMPAAENVLKKKRDISEYVITAGKYQT